MCSESRIDTIHYSLFTIHCFGPAAKKPCPAYRTTAEEVALFRDVDAGPVDVPDGR